VKKPYAKPIVSAAIGDIARQKQLLHRQCQAFVHLASGNLEGCRRRGEPRIGAASCHPAKIPYKHKNTASAGG
jgi:hypothetical protein